MIGRTLDGCTSTVTIQDGLQRTPYVAVGTVQSPAVRLPGTDVAAIVP